MTTTQLSLTAAQEVLRQTYQKIEKFLNPWRARFIHHDTTLQLVAHEENVKAILAWVKNNYVEGFLREVAFAAVCVFNRVLLDFIRCQLTINAKNFWAKYEHLRKPGGNLTLDMVVRYELFGDGWYPGEKRG